MQHGRRRQSRRRGDKARRRQQQRRRQGCHKVKRRERATRIFFPFKSSNRVGCKWRHYGAGAAAAYKRTLARCGCGMGVIILRYMAPVCKYEPLRRAVAWYRADASPIYALPAHKFQAIELDVTVKP